MEISNRGLDLIIKHEGLICNAYRCPAGVLTIGVGHTGDVMGELITEGMVIDIPTAKELLRQDVEDVENQINSLHLQINQNQFDSLVSLVFNIGIGNFLKSTLLRKIKSKAPMSEIEYEFDRWVYGGGKILPGLVNRRKDEFKLYNAYQIR